MDPEEPGGLHANNVRSEPQREAMAADQLSIFPHAREGFDPCELKCLESQNEGYGARQSVGLEH